MSTKVSLPDDPIAAQLGRYIAGLRYEDLPAKVIDYAKAQVIDQLACQLIGSSVPWVEPALKLVQLTKGAAAESTIVNHGWRCLAADAAFVNATFGQACELDDTGSYGAAGHIGAGTVPVALAIGERDRIDGRQFLLSLVVGYEIFYRMMAAVRPHHKTRGFHSQTIGGPFGSAAVAGKLMGLSADQLTHALAIAGSHCCGPIEYDQSGGEVKRIHAGLAARGGMHSAQLAKFGLTGPPTIVEGKRGFCQLFTTKGDPSRVVRGLGEDFSILNNSFKMFPAVGAHHSAITAVGRLIEKHGIEAGQVAKIRVGLAETALLHGAGIDQPQDVIGAQFSLAFSMALALCKRNNDLQRYMDSRLWTNPEIVAMMKRVESYAHPDAVGKKDFLGEVEITLKDGRSFRVLEEYPLGWAPNPATQAQLAAKARSLSRTVLSEQRVEEMVAAVESLDKMKDVSELARLLVRETNR